MYNLPVSSDSRYMFIVYGTAAGILKYPSAAAVCGMNNGIISGVDGHMSYAANASAVENQVTRKHLCL